LGVINLTENTGFNTNSWNPAHPHYVKGNFEVSWKTFTFLFFGIERKDNAALCPRTFEIIRQIPEIMLAQFSLLLPKTHIQPHKGYSPAVLRNHLPLIVPEGDCAIKVGNETHQWKKGELLVFDDSHEHEAWNNSDKTRVILMFDIAKPGYGYDAKEISRYKIANIDDQFLLDIAPKEQWIKWHKQGYFE
jgi:beta-hydroxylase